MQHQSDAQLLLRYARQGSEAAFGEIVGRHADLVYSAAVRQVDSPDVARDVAQTVFIDLARKARSLADKLAPDSSLVGWLYRSTRFATLNVLRDDQRRQARERQAVDHLETVNPPSEAALDWERVRPLLDEAISTLGEQERDALLLRFFKGQDFRAMGLALGVSDDAAQKRVSRALEKLRELLAQRGLTTTAVALSLAMSVNAVQTAPVGLVAILSSTAIAATAIPPPAIAATKLIGMTTLQKSIIGAALVAAIGTGIHEARRASCLSNQLQTLQQQQTPLAEQIQQMAHERDDATNRLASLTEELARRKNNDNELLKLRGEVARLRGTMPSQSNTPIDDAMKTWLVRVTKLKQRIAATPEAKIPEWRFLSEDDYMEAARSALSTEGDYLRALANLRSTAEFRFITTLLNPALTQYAQANNGQFPADIAQLKPYFPSPVEDAILQRWEIAPANTVRTDNFGDPIITQKAAVDENFDPRYAVGLKGFASAGVDTAGHNGWGVLSPEVIMQMAGKAYEAANNGQAPTDSSEILPYLATPEQQAAYRTLMIWNQQK